MIQKILSSIIVVFILVCSSCASSTVNPGKIEVVRVWPEYRTAESFDRISEYFSSQPDKENPGNQITLRTQPAERAGYYFLTRLKTPSDISGATLELSVIAPDSPEPKTHAFKVPLLRKGSVVLNPGLTGTDWPDAKASAVAWKIRLLSADGAELLSQQSYLWSK